MTVEAYYWAPSPPNVGHAALWVSGGSPASDVYLSAWPGGALSILFGEADATRTYEKDCNEEEDTPYYVALTKLDETAIKAAIQASKKAQLYSFLAFNCAVQASVCLNAGEPNQTLPSILDLALSLANPAGSFAWQGRIAYTPWGFWCRAKTLQLQYE
jgi:hypothetical protein